MNEMDCSWDVVGRVRAGKAIPGLLAGAGRAGHLLGGAHPDRPVRSGSTGQSPPRSRALADQGALATTVIPFAGLSVPGPLAIAVLMAPPILSLLCRRRRHCRVSYFYRNKRTGVKMRPGLGWLAGAGWRGEQRAPPPASSACAACAALAAAAHQQREEKKERTRQKTLTNGSCSRQRRARCAVRKGGGEGGTVLLYFFCFIFLFANVFTDPRQGGHG